jgi:hypothetical protein
MTKYNGQQFGHNGRVMFANADEFDSDGDVHSAYVSERDIFENTRALYVSRSAYNNTDDLAYLSNFESLLRDFPGLLGKVWDGGGSVLALDVTDYDPEDEEWGPLGERGNLLDILVRLDDEYPLYDEDDFSAREREQYENGLLEELDWTFRHNPALEGLAYTDADYFWEPDVRAKAWEIAHEKNDYYPDMPEDGILVDAILDAVLFVLWGKIQEVQEENSDPLF